MLICQNNNTPIISLGYNNYTVTQIDYSTQTISLTDADFLAADDTCPRPRHNLTLLDTYFVNHTSWLPDFPSFLRYTSSDVNLTFLLNCSSESPKLDNRITCFRDRSYIFTDKNNSTAEESGWMQSCRSKLVVPVLKEELDWNNESALSSDFGGALKKGFQLGWLNETWGECDQCELSGGRCGQHFTSSSLAFACFCPNGESDHHCGQGNYKKWKIIIEICVALGLILGCLFFLLNLRYKKSKSHSKNMRKVEDFLCKYRSIVPKRYKYSEIKKMTNSFGHKIGQGGYGSVFKGNLDGHLVAVKVLNESKGNGEEFVNEVASISRTSHVNIVCLLGFCIERSKRALIYEFMPNGSLEKFIYEEIPNAKIKLGCEKLYEIAVGIAQGLEYLHRGCNTRMVHFDIKPHNILLDQDFCPKISDFGLAKLCPPKESIISMVGARGTVGYIAPEVFLRNFGIVSSKSDVYSYGMMVLKMVGGRKNIDAGSENTSEIYFPHWMYDHLNQYDALEACGITNETEEIAKRMILVELWCIQMLPADRPSMSRVLDMLEGKVSLQIPPKP